VESVCVPDRFGNTLCCASLEEPIAAAIFASGVYEPDMIAGILCRLSRCDVYDVSANIGAIALPVARQRLAGFCSREAVRFSTAPLDKLEMGSEGPQCSRRLTASRFPKMLFEFCGWAEERIEGQEPGAAQAFLQSLGYWTFQLGRCGDTGAPDDQPSSTGSAILLSQRSET
jgi:hypothetical protein